jgi:hypothetical protein
MILVTGTILAKTETLDELLALSLEHVRRSRTEPGCVMHRVHQDAENPLRLVFVEEWTDKAALACRARVNSSKPQWNWLMRRRSSTSTKPQKSRCKA